MIPVLDPLESQEAKLFVRIAEQIRARGYAVTNDALPQPLLKALAARVRATDKSRFKRAGIGRNSDLQINDAIRGDHIVWVNGQAGELTEELNSYFDWMEQLRLSLNRELLLGLFDYECHYAVYPKNAFYKKHVDAFRGQSNRLLSTVLYLNPAWRDDDGGELVMYHEDDSEAVVTIPPRLGTLVLFLSEEFPHEVLPTRKNRYSLTGWFRVNDPDSIF